MGVHGLWDLLAPVGRRVSVETLSGKKLAIDASIWMVQFMKAMRDEKGEMVRNAHLLGFFRRICKLLFLRTKPIFVFDGGTPALKRRTVIARRRQRENAQAKIRKTAEKLLLNHLKTARLKELANDLEKQRKEQKDGAKKKVLIQEANVEASNSKCLNSEELDLLVTSKVAEENKSFDNNERTSVTTQSAELEEDEDDLIMVKEEKHNSNGKGKGILTHEVDVNQVKLDEMLAMYLMAEEEHNASDHGQSYCSAIPFQEEVGDEQEEMILPEMQGKIDPAVLAALPPSMQLDLLGQMRERLMAENRQRYQKVKKAPEKFSELQIEAYLKTVSFRREIDQVQKAAAGRGVAGIQTSKIASEANREFIFSSSFTGDKQSLSSAGVEKNRDSNMKMSMGDPSTNPVNSSASIGKSTATGFVPAESQTVFDGDIETYKDERGHIRFSRVRAMGIRMTRDLQRNLDLMKEIEQDGSQIDKTSNSQSAQNKNISETQDCLTTGNPHVKSSHGRTGDSVNWSKTSDQSAVNNETSIEISFGVDANSNCVDSDDDVFAQLAAGLPVVHSVDNYVSRKDSLDSVSDDEWEEGFVEGRSNDVRLGDKLSDREVELEEESCGVHESSTLPSEVVRSVNKGHALEEADLEEAIKRSLEDLGVEKCDLASSEHRKLKMSGENVYEVRQNVARNDATQLDKSLTDIKEDKGLQKSDKVQMSEATPRFEKRLNSAETDCPNAVGLVIDNPSKENLVSKSGRLHEDTSTVGDVDGDMVVAESVSPLVVKENCLKVTKSSEAFDQGMGCSSSHLGSHVSEQLIIDLDNTHVEEQKHKQAEPSILINDETNGPYASELCHLVDGVEPSTTFSEESAKDLQCEINVEHISGGEQDQSCQFNGRNATNDKNAQVNIDEAGLEEELTILGQEYLHLGDEQRKLERNAESVSSEMFAECQELLQMFGLPYIIAPMEAEAQCAYMELANLVDGVVTDDSDVFLFGARSVYKNIFDDRKYVETYFMKDIEKELGLTREKLIRMALLLGSDYTEGISGIGIVNAIEVVNAFPEDDGLHKFREWIESPDPNILGKADVQTDKGARKKGIKVGDKSENTTPSRGLAEKEFSDQMQGIKQNFMNKHRNVSKNWHIPSSFPSEVVISAYLSPQVDKSTEPFTWGKPDIHILRRLCWQKFGWNNQKSDDLLLPVLKEYNKHETQLRLEAFYTFNERFAKIRSKRIKKAVKGITGDLSSELVDDSVEGSRKRKKNWKAAEENADNESNELANRMEESIPTSTSNYLDVSKKYRNGKTTEEPVLFEVNKRGQPKTRGRKYTGSGLPKDGRGRARKKARLEGRGGKGKRKEDCHSEQSDSWSGDSTSCDSDEAVNVGQSEIPPQLRRSMRSKNPASYDASELDIDSSDEMLDKCDEENSIEETIEQTPSLAERLCPDTDLGKDDVGQQDLGPSEVDVDVSKDYLVMGGGFCADDSQTGDHPDSGFDCNTVHSSETAENANLSGSDKDTGNVSVSTPIQPSKTRENFNEFQNHGGTNTSHSESSEEKIAASTIGGLTPIPLLKRKRKKN